MRDLWLVAKYEYLRMVAKRSFLISTLALPLVFLAIIVISILIALGGDKDTPIGYIDQAGVMAPGLAPASEDDEDALQLVAFSDDVSARQALEQGQIQAYYVIPPDYIENREVQLYYWDEAPGEILQSEFDDYLRINLASDLPEATRQRLVGGPRLSVRSMDGSREFSVQNMLGFILPFVGGFLFMFTVIGSAGYMIQVVADEKENRTMEIMITSISPRQMIGGKAIGLMGVSLTQLSLWLATAAVGLLVGSRYVEALRHIEIPWSFLLVAMAFFLPAYALVSGLMIAIGASVTETSQGQQIAGVLNLFFMMPYFMIALIMTNPNSPFLVAMTLFPTTSFVTITLRWSMTAVPWWQLITSWILLTGSAAFSIWASARIFRVGMLRYGQELDLRSALQAVRTRNQALKG